MIINGLLSTASFCWIVDGPSQQLSSKETSMLDIHNVVGMVTYPGMEPILTDDALNHLLIYLAETRKVRSESSAMQKILTSNQYRCVITMLKDVTVVRSWTSGQSLPGRLYLDTVGHRSNTSRRSCDCTGFLYFVHLCSVRKNHNDNKCDYRCHMLIRT